MVEVVTKLDDQGRGMFRAYWLTDQAWVPGGVRAQVFHTYVREWIKVHEGKGRKVKLIGERTEVPQ